MLFKIILLAIFVSNCFASIGTGKGFGNPKFNSKALGCAIYIFVPEMSNCTQRQTYAFVDVGLYIVQNIIPDYGNDYGVRGFGVNRTVWSWHDVDYYPNKTGFINEFQGYYTDPANNLPQSASYYELLQDLINADNYDRTSKVAIFIHGETDTIVDLEQSLPLAQQLAAINALIYIWDISINGDQTGLFSAMTGNQPGHIIRANPNANDLLNEAQKQLIPGFLSIACGYLMPTPPPLIPHAPPQYIDPTCPQAATPASTIGYPTSPGTLSSGTTRAVPTSSPTNSSCVSLELIFILDRSQSVIIDYYNNNVTAFVVDIASQFTFYDEATPGNPAYARFGIIQFSDEADVTLPLGNYSQNDFTSKVYANVNAQGEGTSDVSTALQKAYTQFQANSALRNRAIVLVIDDISTPDINQAKDALKRLENYVSLPIGVIMPGQWGSPSEAYKHLLSLLDNRSQLAFPSLPAADLGVPSLIDSTYPCEEPPACAAIIFILEASEVVGADNKLMFLKLSQQIASTLYSGPNQRFAIALYATEVYRKIELQRFDDFNKSISDFIAAEQDMDFPNGRSTYLDPIMRNLNDTIYSGLYKKYGVFLLGEYNVKNPNQAIPYIQSIGPSGANVYVVDVTYNQFPSNLWPMLTNYKNGHVIDGRSATQDSLMDQLSGSLIPEFAAMGC